MGAQDAQQALSVAWLATAGPWGGPLLQTQQWGRTGAGQQRGARLTHLVGHFEPAQQRHNLLLEVLLLQDEGTESEPAGPLPEEDEGGRLAPSLAQARCSVHRLTRALTS